MVGNVTSLTNNGLKDWLIQRVTAVIIGAYFSYFIVYFAIHPEVSFQQWQELFSCMATKVITALTMLSIVFHAWIGIWTVTTDYVKPVLIRLTLQILVALFLLAAFIWVVAIVWGV